MVIGVLLAGCGGGEEEAPPVPKSDFVRQIDRLCAADQRRTDQAGPKFDAAVRRKRLDVAANLVLKLQADEAKTIHRIEAINPPAVDAVAVAEFIRLSRRLNDLDAKIAGAVRAGNLAIYRVTQRQGETLEASRAKFANRIGLQVCGSR